MRHQCLFGVGTKAVDKHPDEKTKEAVMSGGGINRAAMKRGIPQTTHRDYLSGHVNHGDNPGLAPYLNKEEERSWQYF